MNRFTLALGVALLLVEVAVAIALAATSNHESGLGNAFALALSAGIAFMISGLVALWRRPDNRTGVYLAAVGYLWFIGALTESNNPWIYIAGVVLGGLAFMPFAALLLAHPTGRFETRFDRIFPWIVGASLVSLSFVIALFDATPDPSCDGCPDNPLAITDAPGVVGVLEAIDTAVGIVLSLVATALLVRRWRRASPTLRRALWPVLGAGGAALAALVIGGLLEQFVSESAGEAFAPIFLVLFALVPVSFLFGILRVRLARSSVSELVVALEADEPLRDALARTLKDDDLTVLYWISQRQGASGGGWVDPLGNSAPDPTPSAERGVKIVEDKGAPIAAIVYDASLHNEPELLDGAIAAARLTLRSDRLQAELRAEVRYINTVTNTVPSLLTTVGTDGRIRNVNRAAVEVSGMETRDDVVGQYYWDVFIDPSERNAVVGRFAALAPDFPRGEYENAFVNGRGEERVVYWRTAPIHDENGAVFAIISGGVDITERRTRELELERERDVQSTVFEAMPSIIVVLAPDGTIRDRDFDNSEVGANRAFRSAVRWTDEELVGRPFLDLVVEDDDGRAARAVAAAGAGAASELVESDLRSADGTTRTFAWSAIPVADVTNRMESLVLVSGIDITERKRREEEIRAGEERFRAVIDSAPVAITEIDLDDKVRLWNPAAEQIFGWSADEIVGSPPFWVPDDLQDEYQALSAREAAGSGYTGYETVRVHRDGHRLEVEVAAAPIRDAEGDVVGAMAVLSDISDRKRQEEELRASRARLVAAGDEARRQLERNLHDGAQQRLVALSVALRLAESKLVDDPEAAAAIMAGAREELGHALEELRELARGIHPAVLTDRGLEPALTALVSRASLPVDVDVPPDRLPPAVEAASYYVVAEALTNVAKYSGATKASVDVRHENGRVVVEVRDDGAGGADPSRGSGLRGLADRVAVLDGTLVVESPAGKGTIVRAEIPVVEDG